MTTHPSSRRILAPGLAALTLGLAAVQALAQEEDTFVFVEGRVGIGTENPDADARLHVVAATSGRVDGLVFENTSGPARIRLFNGAVTQTAEKDPNWAINSNGDLRFTTDGSGPAEMRLDAAGNLRIVGSISVGGQTLNVPDYVFDPEFPLMSMDELKDYVDENRHLPEIPSGNDIARDGLDMTDMQLRLLRKVEELTLYAIDQHETIEILKHRIHSLEQTIANDGG